VKVIGKRGHQQHEVGEDLRARTKGGRGVEVRLADGRAGDSRAVQRPVACICDCGDGRSAG